MLEIKNLNVKFKNQNVLDDLNFSIQKGKIIGLLGKNGAGKTTFFESLYQNVKYEGEILLDGTKLKRNQIAYLETENYFYPYITGNEYLSYFSGQKNNTKNELVNIFQLPLDKYVQFYSSGMKKKLALIGMLMLDKPINILDEPFNGVDFEGVYVLYDLIKKLKSENKIVIVSSHIIETLFHTCDELAVLKDGKITQIFQKSEFHLLNQFKF